MWRCVCVLVVVAGCWSEAPLVDGELTATQLARLRDEMKLPELDPCAGIPRGANCDAAARLGQDMFFEPALSHNAHVACVTCHDPRAWFIDTRTPNNVSLGVAKWTGRNAMATVDLVLKTDLAPLDEQGHRYAFTWTGRYESPGEVMMKVALPNTMGSTMSTVVHLITSNTYYASEYLRAFPDDPNETEIISNAEIAMTAYLRRVYGLYSGFDNYMLGDDGALSEPAKRGFGVFVGRGACIECHRGPALTDFGFHVTGVPQTGENVPLIDKGRSDVTGDPADDGKFLTPPLHDVARTGPYMHDGALASLEDVVEFYRGGGAASGYSGTKDPRIQKLDITDQDAEDLVAFLRSLNGEPIPAELTVDLRPFRDLCGELQVCDAECVNTQINVIHCGSCDHECPSGTSCAGGTCVPSTCVPSHAPCGDQCVDLANDPANCGMCGHTCTTSCTEGQCDS
jgi:cytochrome c peroxidase